MLSSVMMAMAKDLMNIVRDVLSSDLLINHKVGRNTIIDSSLFKEVAVKSHVGDDNPIVSFMLNDYVQYIESGRRAGSKMPPLEPIVQWARKRGIPTDSRTMFAIRKKIAEDGIRPRPFMDRVWEICDREWDESWSDLLFNEIMKLIDEFFS